MDISSENVNPNSFREENGKLTVDQLQPRIKSKFTLKNEPCRLSGRISNYERRQRKPRQKSSVSAMIGLMFSCFRKSR